MTDKTEKANTQQDQLYKPFPDEMIKQTYDGMNYVPVAEVINRMNSVLGTGSWSSQIVNIFRDENDPRFVICQVSVTAQVDGKHVIADGVGGKDIALKRGSNEIVDLSNDYKSAYSDALKKACQRLGVGLHLARDEEAIYQDVEHEVDVEDWNRVNSKIKELSELQLTALKEWWDANGNGPKPNYDTMTADLFNAYRAKAKSIAQGVDNALTPEEVAAAVGGTIEALPVDPEDEAPF